MRTSRLSSPIIQLPQHGLPHRSDEILFIAGLLTFTLGQVLLNLGQSFVSSQRPVDFAHWCLLIGAVSLLPFAARLPKRNIHLIGIPVLIAGIAAIVGMCVLDFIFWSLPAGPLRDDIIRHLIDTPSIWQVFIVYGPNHVFVTGLALPALSYWHRSRSGTVLVILASLLMAFTGREWIVPAYLLMIAGYVLAFRLLQRH